MLDLRDVVREWAERDRSPILLLALVVIGFFLPSLIIPGILIWPHSGLGSDIAYRHWPDLIGYAEHWRAGHAAVWDSLVALGRPLAGDPGVLFLYPFGLLFMVLPPALAFNVLDALHVFLAGLFTFWLLRVAYGQARPAALLGGLTFAFAPKFISHLAGGHIGIVWGLTWAPAVLLGLQLALDGSLLAAALAGLALALQMPTHIQIPYYTAAIGSAFWLWHAAPVVWRGIRGERSEWRQAGRLVAVYLIWLLAFGLLAAAVLLPFLELLPYNSRAGFSLEDANLYALPPVLLYTLLVPSNFQFPEWTIFLGVLPLVLGTIGWLWSGRNVKWFFALLTGFALIYALGTSTPLFGLAFAMIPGLQFLRVPTRLWLFAGLAVAVLAGLGADSLTDRQMRDSLWQRRRWLIRAAVLSFIAGGMAWLGHWVLVRRLHAPLSLVFMTAALLAILAAAWLTGRISGRALQWALIPVLLLDLLPLDASYIDLVDPRTKFLRSTPALDFVAAQPGVFRVYSSAGDLPYALAGERGVESLEGLLAFQIGHAVDAIRDATGCAKSSYATAIPPCLTDRSPAAVPDAEQLGQLNVRYVLSKRPLVLPGFKLVLNSSPAVYENLRWQPRVQVRPAGTAEIVSRQAGEYDIAVSATQEVQLIVRETWLPGWQATDGGQPHPVERIDGAFIGLALSPGEHLIHLHYAPLGWHIGWLVSLGSLIGLAIWVASKLWRMNSRNI